MNLERGAVQAQPNSDIGARAKPFRFDINGLRAWAVVAVILYHFGVPGFSAGFVGVDVFFVISGFLMTSIIIESLESKNGLSVFGFYVARAKRIVPALLLLCVTLMLLGWLALPAFEYGALGVQVISALGFFSNIKFWRETNYFSDASQDQWMLHTWSLSAEWQFYLLLPVLLLALWRLKPGRGAASVLLGLLFIASLALSVLVSEKYAPFAFYLLPARAWEMLAGAMVYLLAGHIVLRPLVRRVLELLGLVLIIAAIVIFDVHSVWPGWYAAVPVLGSALVLLAARQTSIWTGTRIAQWLGNCSYSLYLWHWPIVVGLVYANLKGNVAATLIGLAATLVLAWASYTLVEQRIRTSLGRRGNFSSAALIASCVLVVTLPSLFIKLHGGVPGRIDAHIDAVYNEASDMNPRLVECFAIGNRPVPGCTYGGKDLGVIVIGDSHAGAIMRSMEQALPSKDLHVLDWSLNACPTVAGIKSTEDGGHCGDFIRQAIEKQKTLPQDVPLVILNRSSLYAVGPNEPGRETEIPVTPYYFDKPFASRSVEYQAALRDGIVKTACELARTRPVYMLRPIPEMKYSVPKTMGRALMFGRGVEVSLPFPEYQQRNRISWETQDLAVQQCGVTILDPTAYLCGDGACKGARNGIPLYYDDDHLSERGAALLIPMFRSIFSGGVETTDVGHWSVNSGE
ncbi:acyltransferase family protein [Comamonas terrigena]|uniref:acyltransferase family protein n=1 Tax=Comamonas terrigena TaxID=32013 RepID=UPI002448EABC|nr:acyltransferase family protein [Comamonas terrigena]MDH1700765.1 acyltransferase [Comamonas terrigena]